MLPNGKTFEFVQNKEADPTTGSSSKPKSSEGIPIEPASKNSIRNESGIVNKNEFAKSDKVKMPGRKGEKLDNRMTEADIKAVQNIGRKSVNAFSAADIKATERFANQYWKEMGVKSPFFRAWFGDWRANDQTPVQVATKRGDTCGVQKNTDTGWDIQASGQVFNETKVHQSVANREARPYLPCINDIVKKAILLDSYGLGIGDAKSANSLLMHSMYAVADIGNGPEVLKLYVEEMNDPNQANTAKQAYQLQNIEKAFNASVRVQGQAPSSLTSASNAIRTVADLFASVKQKDADFNPNPSSVTGTYLYRISSTQIGVWFEVIATHEMDELGVSSIVMQRSSDGSSWENVKTYRSRNYSVMVDENQTYYANSASYTAANNYYRARVQFYAKDASGIGYYTAYTSAMFFGS